jgi:hypothetical protein
MLLVFFVILLHSFLYCVGDVHHVVVVILGAEDIQLNWIRIPIIYAVVTLF